MHRMIVFYGVITFVSCPTILYRVIQEKKSVFLEVVVSVIVRDKIRMNTCLILIGYRDKTFLIYKYENIMNGNKER